MSMTMTQKILAKHAGLESVVAGQLIEAKLDMVLGNDVTSPVAINEMTKFGKNSVFDKTKISLKALKEPCEVKLTTDSKYVCDSVTKGWVYSWQKNNWKKADKKPALNVDLWEELLPLLEKHTVTFNWVKGHNGHPYNERCDELAVNYYKNL